MLQVFTNFCEFLGVSPQLAGIVFSLSIMLFGLNGKKLEYKVEDEKENKIVKIYRYK